MTGLPHHLSQRVSAWVGGALGGLTRVAGAVRPSAKPLHPRGTLRRARLERHGVQPASGVAFLDDVGVADVIVRESRAAGLPRPLPDVHGFALRVPNADGTVGDVLFSTTGTGPLTRFLLLPSFTATRPMTTLLPYDTAAGPVVLAVRSLGRDRRELGFAVGDGPWHAFAELTLGEEIEKDVSFDAVRNTLPGLDQYAAVRRLREPSYAAARASRDQE